jgi:hypothetical protein
VHDAFAPKILDLLVGIRLVDPEDIIEGMVLADDDDYMFDWGLVSSAWTNAGRAVAVNSVAAKAAVILVAGWCFGTRPCGKYMVHSLVWP